MINRTTIIAAIAVTVLVLCASAYAYVVYRLTVLERELGEEQSRAALVQAEAHDRNNLLRLLEETEAERTEIDTYLIYQKDIINFLSLVEALGRSHKATVSTASLTVVSRDDLLDEPHVTISASGSREAVLHVLRLLETLPYKSYVKRAGISKVEAGIELWNGSFDIVVVKHKEEQHDQ